MLVTIKHRGSFKNTEMFLNRASNINYTRILERYGQEGVNALAESTPTNTGETANSWIYEIQYLPTGIKLMWKNTNIVDGVPIAILIQYGHGTRNGGYVQGIDYINPALRPIFDRMINETWKGVTQ